MQNNLLGGFMEEWKDVPNTEGKIQISNAGRVRSKLRGSWLVLKQQDDQKGYKRVSVTINRVKHTYKVHRLVAQAFINNPDDLPQVNHIDGNKHNNNVNNLEWCTNIDNCHHAIKHGLWATVFAAANAKSASIRKPVIAHKGDKVLRFFSVVEAQDYFNSRHISDVLKGKRNHVKGWSFEYEGR